MTKYHARRTEVDGITFDSLAEARRYGELKLLQAAGEIDTVIVHPVWPIVVNGALVCRYEADFQYHDYKLGCGVVEDVKSKPTMTPTYRLKKKLMKAVHNIEIVEVSA